MAASLGGSGSKRWELTPGEMGSTSGKTPPDGRCGEGQEVSLGRSRAP